MTFSPKIATGALLVGLTLIIQCAWIAILIVWGRTHLGHEQRRLGPARAAWMMVWIIADMVVLHVVEILVWGGFYRWKCFPNWASAFYFSAGAYTTVGSGELLPGPEWRSFQPLESLTGILMCGLSASFLFAVVTRLVQHEENCLKQESAHTTRQVRAGDVRAGLYKARLT
jgi:hypothetical protein